MSWLYSGVSSLAGAAYNASGAAYNAYYGPAEEELPIEVSSPTPAARQFSPSGEPVNPLYSGSGSPQNLQQRVNTAVSLPLPMSSTASTPVHDDEAQLQLAVRLSLQHPKVQESSTRPQAVSSLSPPPAARNNMPIHQPTHLDDDAALAEALRLSEEHAQQRPTQAVRSSSQAVLSEDEEFERVLQLSLKESKAAAAANQMAQLQLNQKVTTTASVMSLAEQEAYALELATKRSLSTKTNQHVPMLGNKNLIADVIVEMRRVVEEERAKVALAHNDLKAQEWSLSSIQKNTAMADQLEHMGTVYKYFQPVRGDGNCFYTTFAFDMLLGFSKLTGQQKSDLIAKFSTCRAPVDARVAVVGTLKSLEAKGAIRAEDKLMVQFVQCLRAIGVAYVQSHRNEFYFDEVNTFEKLILDLGKMGEDAQEPMIIALVKALDHPVRIVRATPNGANILGTAGTFNYEGPTRSIDPNRDPARVVLFTDGHYQMLSKN